MIKTEPPPLRLRSETVQEILSARPHWIVRHGNLTTLSVCMVLLAMGGFFRYPVYIPVNGLQVSKIGSSALVSGRVESDVLVNANRDHVSLKLYGMKGATSFTAQQFEIKYAKGQEYFEMKTDISVTEAKFSSAELCRESTVFKMLRAYFKT